MLATGLFAPFVGWVSYRSWSVLWPRPQRLSFARLRTPRGRRQLAEVLGFGLAFGLPGGLAFGWAVGPGAGLAAWLAVMVAAGLTTGLSERAEAGAPDPRSIVRDDFGSGLGFGLVFGTMGVLATVVWLRVSTGFAPAIVLGAALGLGLTLAIVIGFSGALDSDGGVVGDPGGLAACRYLALLLCTRRLPWRLGRFLDLCYRAGLVRIAGAGYQFRHRELQDYLAAHPTA